MNLSIEELELLQSALLSYYQACKEVHGHGSKTMAISALIKKAQEEVDFQKNQSRGDRNT
ncbi:hypothetical protein NDI52_30120 [Leptolyngbya sp. PL-A3]|uniref:hypothetical protein n=1 Tax=Leptolyngbya sp. PL-A3 TaxID=2933911 RepID=UPI003299EE06